MALRKLYKQAVGKVVAEIDSVEQADGEIYVGIKFKDGSDLSFCVSPRIARLRAYRGRAEKPKNYVRSGVNQQRP